MRINGHGHILPEPFQIPKFMKEKRLFWIDEDKKYMRQGDWSRPINNSSFFLKDKLLICHLTHLFHEFYSNGQ